MFSALKSRLLGIFLFTLLFTSFLFSLPVPAAAASFTAPNTESDVPQNSHTYTQTVLIDILSAISCQIVGIDPTDTSKSCLTVNPETHKIGYAPQQDGQLGGVIGVLTDQIGVLYTAPAGSGQYVSYMASNFGIVKPAVAANTAKQDCTRVGQDPKEGVGFCSLQPIFELWKTSLNVAYFILVLVFIFIGVAVMLRIKIDPRTVMTVQNQIPRVVICILLITLSYAIAGFMIDMMWTGTYVGINAIASGKNDVLLPGCGGGGNNEDNAESKPDGASGYLSGDPTNPRRLSAIATSKLLDTPISYFNQVFHSNDDGVGNCDSVQNGFSGGIFHVTQAVSHAIGGLVRDVITQLLGQRDCNPVKAGFQAITGGLFGGGEIKDCASKVLSSVFGFLANIISWLIILCAILISLFRVWFKLIQAYIHILFYVIAAPIWIAMGLIPGRPLGFENWMRNLFANMAVFPLTAFLFVAARVFLDAFNVQDSTRVNPNSSFIPPLVGNPNMEVFGTLLAFGVVLMAPGLLDLLKEKMKAQGTKIGGLAAASMGAAVGAATAVPKRQWANLTAKDQYGGATGPVSAMTQNMGRKFMTSSKSPVQWVPGVKNWAENRQRRKDRSRSGMGYTTPEEYKKRQEKLGVRTTEGNVMGNRSAAGQGEGSTPQGQLQRQGRQWPPQNGGPLPGLPTNPKSPTTPGGQGMARELPQGWKGQGWKGTPVNKPEDMARIGAMGQGSQKSQIPSWKKPSEGIAANTNQDMSRIRKMGQSPFKQDAGNQPAGGKQIGSLNVNKLTAGQLSVQGGLGGKHEPAPGIAPAPKPWTQTFKEAGQSVKEGWKDMNKADENLGTPQPAEGSAKPAITDIGQASSHNESKTKHMAEEFAHRMNKYQEHEGGEEPAQPAPAIKHSEPQTNMAMPQEVTHQESQSSQIEEAFAHKFNNYKAHEGGEEPAQPAPTIKHNIQTSQPEEHVQEQPTIITKHSEPPQINEPAPQHVTQDVTRTIHIKTERGNVEEAAPVSTQHINHAPTTTSMHPGGQGATEKEGSKPAPKPEAPTNRKK